jgi:hypothetical protein
MCFLLVDLVILIQGAHPVQLKSNSVMKLRQSAVASGANLKLVAIVELQEGERIAMD